MMKLYRSSTLQLLLICSLSVFGSHAQHLLTTVQSITALEGQSISFDCILTPNNTTIRWLHDGEAVLSSERVTLSPLNLHYTLSISDLGIIDSGQYTCYFKRSELYKNKSINVTVLRACQQDYSGGLLWERQTANQLARISCSRFHPSFHTGVYITRMCSPSGEWGRVEYCSCTMRLSATPFIMIEVKEFGSNITTLSDQVVNSVERASYNVTQKRSELFEVSSANFLAVFVDVNTDKIHDDIQDAIIFQKQMTSDDYIISVTGFQPSYQCSCCGLLMVSVVNNICIGPSIPPCTVNEDGSFQCESPSYTGNGIVCGLDSDGDGFPDVQLDCTGPQCEQDICPRIYNLANSQVPCSMQQGVGCQLESDTVWGLEWPFTASGSVAVQACPGLSGSKGLSYRRCLGNSSWDVVVNVTQCQNIELDILRDVISELEDIVQTRPANNTIDLTVMLDVTEVQALSGELASHTDTTQTFLFVSDLETINDIISSINIIVRSAVVSDIAVHPSGFQAVIEDVATAIDNLLSNSNKLIFDEAKNMKLLAGEDLLRNTEMFAIAIGDVLMASGSNNSVNVLRQNIAFNAQMQPVDPDLITSVTFPDEGDTQITIPADAIRHQRSVEGVIVPVVSFIAKNLQSYLYDQFTSDDNGTAVSIVISSQISTGYITLPENSSVTLKFNEALNISKIASSRCIFWDFGSHQTNNQGRGRWSGEGIVQDDDNNLPILCSSTHLTSFSILISEVTEKEDDPHLNPIIYIGCTMSIFSLVLILFRSLFESKIVRKKLLFFVNVNLTVAILIKNMMLVSGVETARENTNSCIVVTTLLHYLSMCIFSWSVCAAITILVKLVTSQSYKGIFQKRILYFIIGWGWPIIIAGVEAATSHDHYGIFYNEERRICWISNDGGIPFRYIGPVILMMLICYILLCTSCYKIIRRSTSRINALKCLKTSDPGKFLWTSTLYLPLVHFNWIVGYVFMLNDINSTGLSWAFAALSGMLGWVAIPVYLIIFSKKSVPVSYQSQVDSVLIDSNAV